MAVTDYKSTQGSFYSQTCGLTSSTKASEEATLTNLNSTPTHSDRKALVHSYKPAPGFYVDIGSNLTRVTLSGKH